jgi:hypothetical protein
MLTEDNKMTHLDALHLRLSTERVKLANAKPTDVTMHKVIIRQVEREISGERAFLGLSAHVDQISDDALLAELLGA